MIHKTPFAAALVLLAGVTSAHAAVAKQIVRFDAQRTPNLLKGDSWGPYGKGFQRDGDAMVCDNGGDAGAERGVCQVVALNQKTPQPIVASAWSKARDVGGGKGADYSLYLDLVYADGEPLWGQIGSFNVGTHDWERREVRVVPGKPVKSLSLYLLLRHRGGKAWFRDPRLYQVDMPAGAASFDGIAVAGGGGARDGFAVRDVAADSDFVTFEDGKALGLKLEVETTARGIATFRKARLTDTSGKDRAITLVYTSRVPEGPWRWLADPRRERPAMAPLEYHDTLRYSAGSDGRLSRYPFAAVARENDGRGVAIDMGWSAYFRVGFSAGFNELYAAYDLGLAAEKNSAEVCLCTWSFDAAWGFRGAVAAMYRIFPDYFRCRTPRQGVWMPFAAISKVEGWEDFGFKFKEGNDETPWDDAHDVLTFRYTEPMTWWMPMPRQMPRTIEAALAEAKRLADKGDRNAQALFASGYHHSQGGLPARLLDTPWCNGAVWSMNSSPLVSGAVTDFKNKWNAQVREGLYGPNRKGDLDGEYVDSSEGYVTDELNYRREHFAGARAPLTFSTETRRVAIFRGLIAYEYVRALELDVHGMGRLMMANGTPHGLCWLAPWLDVMGTETNWNHRGRWAPMADREMLYRRVLCGPKPYCFLMNTVFAEFPRELSEKYMKRCLAYGMFPGFFSADASTGHYFTHKELYNRDRPLFKKYVPLCKAVAEASWQPVTLARSSDPKVYVERFGRKYLTVFNDSAEKKTVTITLDGVAPGGDGVGPGGEGEPVSSARIPWHDNKATFPLDAEDVAVLEIK